MTLIVVRHGESRGNYRGMIQGTLDEPLTDTGLDQAEAVAERLASVPASTLYASPLARAFVTAERIAARLQTSVVTVKELQERHFGEAQGMTGAELNERWPARASHQHDWGSQVPGVEPLVELRRRAAHVLDELLERHEADTAIAVSHGGTITQMVAYALGLAEDVLPRIRLGNTAVTVFEGIPGRPVITMLNDRCHLRVEQRTSPPPV